MSTIYEKFKELKIDRMIKATIGMSREKFDTLVPVFADVYQTIQEERLQRKEVKRLWKSGPKGVLDTPEKRLFFVLYYLKTYPTFDVLGFQFDLSAGHAHDDVAAYLPVLQRTLGTLNVLPKRAIESVEEFRQLVDQYSKLLIDCTEAPCVRPCDDDEQSERYSGKKKRHTLKSLMVTDAHRQILLLSPLYGGSVHDYTLMKETFDPAQPYFADDIEVKLDLGFLGAQKDYGSSMLLPHKKPRKSENNPTPALTEQQKEENYRHAKERIIVEHAIGGMKAFYCLTHRIRNQSIAFIDQLFAVSAGLWNLKIA
jgi:hypothetical protein